MYLVAIAWMYVVLMVAAAEAMAPNGTLLGALFTVLLWGVLPMSVVLYVLGSPARRAARRRAEEETEARDVPPAGQASAAPPDGHGLPPAAPVAPVREEP